MARLVRTTATAVVVLLLGLAATPALGITRPVYSNRVSPFPKGKRGFCFKNSCSFPVRVGQTGASTGIPCSEGCPQGTICNGPVNLCFFSVDAIRNIGILAPNSERKCVTIDYPTVETRVYVPTGIVKLRVTFSGALYASTGCSAAGICETALCKNCPSYVGPNGPMMQAEMTLQEVDQDYYDVTAIHGSNAPMVMKALSPSGTFYQPDHGIASYQCGEPGTVTPQRGEKASSWQFRPTAEIGGSARYAVVRNTGVPCSPSCKETCGLAYRSVEGGPTPDLIPNTCGQLLGVWTDNEMCAWSDALPFDWCQKVFPNAELGGTYHQAFDCSGPYKESCFQRAAVPGCCGCTVWPELGLEYDTSNPCWSESKGWMEIVKPRLHFIKEACPTCYTYPYDDATSLFVCRTPEEDGLNMASYEIEWCPSGIELSVKTAGTGDDDFTPVPNTPWTPNPPGSTPTTPKPATPTTPKPATPTTPKPATPTPPNAPLTPTPAWTPPSPNTPQPPTPFTPNPAWTPVSPSTPNPASGPSGSNAPSTSSPSGPSGPGTPATPVPNAPPQAAVDDKSGAQSNTMAIALGVVAVALAVLLVGGIAVGVVFRKKLFGDKDAAANAVPASPAPNQPLQRLAPGSPREPMYEEDQGAASTERLN